DLKARELAGELDVVAAFADGQSHLVGLHVHLGPAVLVVQLDVAHLGRAQRTLDQQLVVAGEVDHVDVLVAQLAHDAVDAAALHAHAGAHRVDAVVVALHGHFGTFTGLAHDALDGDQAIGHLGHLMLEQFGEELGGGAAQDHHGGVVPHLHLPHHGAHGVALLDEIALDLLVLGQDQLVALVVQHQRLTLPHLVHLASDDVAHALLVLVVEVVLLQFHDAALEVLLQRQDVAAAKVLDLHLLAHLFAHLEIGVDLPGLAQLDIQIVVLAHAVLHDHAVQPDLQVTLVRVDDDVHVGLFAKALLHHAAEDILQDAHQGHTVDVLEVLELAEGLDEVYGAHGTFQLNLMVALVCWTWSRGMNVTSGSSLAGRPFTFAGCSMRMPSVPSP